MLVHDVNNAKSFEALDNWRDEFLIQVCGEGGGERGTRGALGNWWDEFLIQVGEEGGREGRGEVCAEQLAG